MDQDRPTGPNEAKDDTTRLFESIRAFEPDATVVDWSPRDRAKWKARMQAEDEARYGKTPRNTWPPAGSQYSRAEIAERDYWIRKLYGEEELTVQTVARTLGLHTTTIHNRIKVMGIGRRTTDGRTRMGRDTAKRKQVETRRRLLRQLYDNGANVTEISAELGWHESTIRHDLQAMGLPVKPPPRRSGMRPKETSEMVDSSVRQLAGIAQLVLTAKLGDPEATVDQVRDWEASLARVTSAVRKLRKTMKGNHNDE